MSLRSPALTGVFFTTISTWEVPLFTYKYVHINVVEHIFLIRGTLQTIFDLEKKWPNSPEKGIVVNDDK